jgi:arylsulfatase A-like enzyme
LTENYNIILVTLDGFRKDKIDLCSSLTSFKNDCLYFNSMITVSPYTLASLHAIFSGMYPQKNGVSAYYNMFKFKKDSIITIPQFLQSKNYYTCCDVISKVTIPSQGFDEYNIFDEKTVDFKKRHCDMIKSLSQKQKFFLFLHYTEPHKHLVDDVIQKYKQEENDDDYFSNKKENESRYESYLPECNNYVNSILQTIDKCGLSDNTIIIFHADHGTSMGEKKGEKFYGVFVYDYTINTFCMMKVPGIKPKIISQQCRTIDLFPTIAHLSNFTLNTNFDDVDGENLFQLIDDDLTTDREVFVETGGLYGPWPSPKKHNVFCIRFPTKKLIYNYTPNTWEFYDLTNDPNELENIYNSYDENIKKLKIKLLKHFKLNPSL